MELSRCLVAKPLILRPTKNVLAAVSCILLTFFLFEVTDWDIRIQQLFFNAESGRWLIDSEQPMLRLLFYDGPKTLLILLALSLLVAIPIRPKPSRRALCLAVLTLMLVPLSVSSLKATTNMPCPKAISSFGGSIYPIKVLERYPPGSLPSVRQRCFPAGHASGGFALIGLLFLSNKPKIRRRIVCLAIVAGSFMGGYKMLIGDHFMSHTLITFCISWLVVGVLGHWETGRPCCTEQAVQLSRPISS
jgi:membrane-associated PAP2 superfamily phosphatase